MHLFESAFALRKPILIGAFEGWNDAAESASGAIEHLLTVWSHHRVAKLDSEDYYDYQVNRPHIRVDEKVVREIVWPNTTVYEVSTPHLPHDFLIVKGIEPSMRWRSFCDELLDLADDYEVSMVVTLGALLADSPHSRPIVVTGSGAHPDVASRLGVEISRYEGPTGIKSLAKSDVAPTKPIIQEMVNALADDLDAPRVLRALEQWCSETESGSHGGEAGELARALDLYLGIAI
ncbi:MAG: PAC2 family protein [Actinobacteria bacterium]|nr:PAC2 family protein [Actinomycetota bacterium]